MDGSKRCGNTRSATSWEVGKTKEKFGTNSRSFYSTLKTTTPALSAPDNFVRCY